MNCSEARELIPLYLSGLLEDPEELLKHLDSCPDCAREMQLHLEMERLLSVPPVPEGLSDRVIRSLRPVMRTQRPVKAWLDALQWGAIALGLGLALAVILVGHINEISGAVSFIAGAF